MDGHADGLRHITGVEGEIAAGSDIVAGGACGPVRGRVVDGDGVEGGHG